MSETVGDFDLDFPGFFRWSSFKIKERFLGLGIFLGLQSADIFQIIGIIAAKGAMQRFNGYDPDYLEYVGRLKTEKYTQPQESFFYFEATPSEKAREIEIEVTDRFGHIFPRQKVVLLPDK